MVDTPLLIGLCLIGLLLPLLLLFLLSQVTSLLHHNERNVSSRQLVAHQQEEEDADKNEDVKLYITRFAIPFFVYNVMVVSFCGWGVLDNFLEEDGSFFAKDLYYYANVQTKSFETYQSLLYAQRWQSYFFHEISSNPSHAASSSSIQQNDDFVVVYHTSDWSNMLTDVRLSSACQLEKDLLLKSECDSNELDMWNASVLLKMLDSDCMLVSSIDNTVAALTSADNRNFVKDSIYLNQTETISEVIVSYFPSCIFSSSDVDDVDEVFRDLSKDSEVKMTYVQNDIVASAFEKMFQSDVIVCLICCAIAVVVYIIFVSSKLAVSSLLLTSVSVLFALGLLQAYGYEYISYYGLVISPLLMIWWGMFILTFSQSWEVQYIQSKRDNRSRRRDFNYHELVVEHTFRRSYRSTARSLYCFGTTAVVVGLSITLSPMTTVSQFGELLTICVIWLFLLFHVLVLPAFVVLAKLSPNYHCRKLPNYQTEDFGMEIELDVELENNSVELEEQEQEDQETHLDESRDVLPELNTPRQLSYRFHPSSSRSRLRPSVEPRTSSSSDEMLPLATDTLVQPRFSNYDDDRSQDYDFDDDVSEFTRESGMFSAYTPAYDNNVFQQENPAMLTERDQNVDDDDDDVEDDLTDHENEYTLPMTLGDSTVLGFGWDKPPRYMYFILTGIILCSLVIFYVLVKYFIGYSSTFEIIDNTNLSDFAHVSGIYKNAFYAFSGSMASFLSPTFNASVDYTAGGNGGAFIDSAAGFRVSVCYGLHRPSSRLDDVQSADYFVEEFEAYVLDETERGILSDMNKICSHVANHTEQLSVSRTDPENACLYTQLQRLRDNSTHNNLFETIFEWMTGDAALQERVGVSPKDFDDVTGNFGPELEYNLVWLCESFDGASSGGSDFATTPTRACDLAYQWERVVEDAMLSIDLPVLVTADSWMPVEVEKEVQLYSRFTILSIVFGTFVVISFLSWDIKLATVIEMSSIIVTLFTLLLHSLIFSSTGEVSATDVAVIYLTFLISMHFQIFVALKLTSSAYSDPFAHAERREKVIFSVAVLSLIVVGISFSLLFSKLVFLRLLGEYFLLGCVVSGVCSSFVLPHFVRLSNTTVLNPVTKYFRPLPRRTELEMALAGRCEMGEDDLEDDDEEEEKVNEVGDDKEVS